MKKIKFCKDNYEQISSIILHDINTLRNEGKVPFENIKVAMSNYVTNEMANFWFLRDSKLVHDNHIFGIEIVEGINDQIVIVDKNATVDDFCIDPIKLIFEHE